MEAATHPTAGWERVGDRFYRKTQLYTAIFDQDLDLENYIVAGAPYGGALAIYRDESKIVSYRPSKSAKPGIDIYSCAGKLLKSIAWDRGSIKGLGWSEDERLLVVGLDGTVRCYYGLQGDFTQFSLGREAEDFGVHSCRFYDHGMVALLTNNVLISVTSYDEPRPKLLAAAPEGEVHAWAIISPSFTLSRSVEVLLSIGRTIYVVDGTDCEDRFLDIGPFSHISVSPNGKFAALFAVDGKAHVITADFQSRLSEHDSKSQVTPTYLQWCGNDAVVIAWEDEVNVVGPNNAVASYVYEARVHVISDHDGVRLLTNDVCDFLQKVPDVTDEVFRYGTQSPASVLLDAVEQLENQSPKADDNIQLIRPNLVEAVDTCVAAAGHEFNIHWQKQLLKAASFGKSVLDIYNSDDFVDMCETLRVLNAVRYYEVGLPLSYEQYQRLTPEGLVERLVNRHEHLLALRAAGYLRLPTDRIYVHWACAKVRSGAEDDGTICRMVVERLAGKPGISFEAIARAAYDEGRGRLATELLDHEPRAGRQVPLLLSMEEDEIALDKAVESGDSDLTLCVLLHLKKKLPLASFFRTISARPAAAALFEASAARERDYALLKDLYYQDDRRADGAGIFVREALRQPDARTAGDKLALASKLLADSREHGPFETAALKEASALLRVQEALDRDLPLPSTSGGAGVSGGGEGSFSGLSVNETLFRLIRLGYHNKAKKIQSEFKIPEKVVWWVRLRALVAKRDWNEIEEIAKNRKSPIGWEPFFNQTLQAGNQRLAATFIPKCASATGNPGEAALMYERCGMRVRAAEEAARAREAPDPDFWTRLLEAAGGRATPEGREVERLSQQHQQQLQAGRR